MVFIFSSIGLPGLNGFVGEFMILTGSFQRAWTGVSPALQQSYLILSLMGVVGIVLGAWYMLWAVERVFFGNSRLPPFHNENETQESLDLRWHEIAALAPLTVFVLWIGITPATFLGPSSQSVRTMTLASSNAFNLQMQQAQNHTSEEIITHNNDGRFQQDQHETNPIIQKPISVKQ